MKKYALLLLVLTLALGCLMALSSCGKEPACEHTWNDGEVTTAATCTVDGVMTFTCTNCGETKPAVIPATGHDWNAGTITTPATCTDDGVKTSTCSKCNETKTETVDALGHSWGIDYTVDKPATCKEKGSKSIHCAKCDATKESTEIALAEHTCTYTTVKAPSNTADGEKTGVCSVCGNSVTKTIHFASTTILDGMSGSAPAAWGYNANLFTDRLEMTKINHDLGHFYPTAENPEGRDLFLEFSFLWNETLNLGSSSSNIAIGRFDKSGGTPTATAVWLHLGTGDDSCPFVGGFELGQVKTVTYGPSSPDNGTAADYVNIGGYGWHRIGIRWHQTASIVDGAVVYTMTYTLYLDGEKVNEVLCNIDRFTVNDYLLFTAKIDPDDNTKLIYGEVSGSKKQFTGIRSDNFFGSSDDKWVVIADYSLSAGSDFRMQVQKIETPVAEDFTVFDDVVNGERVVIELDGTMHYAKVAD
ncbi:MAG: hypothetical protein MJ082_00300 [Clostridia bacterium]|nr:hypothetical protein [Clostridia bacterium]